MQLVASLAPRRQTDDEERTPATSRLYRRLGHCWRCHGHHGCHSHSCICDVLTTRISRTHVQIGKCRLNSTWLLLQLGSDHLLHGSLLLWRRRRQCCRRRPQILEPRSLRPRQLRTQAQAASQSQTGKRAASGPYQRRVLKPE